MEKIENHNSFYLHENPQRPPKELFKFLVRLAEPDLSSGSTVLDIGCASGAFLHYLRSLHPTLGLAGIDVSPEFIEKARETGLYAELETNDMLEGLRTKPDASADLILAADAMVYVADLVPILKEANRVLAASGVLAFTLETHAGDGVVIGDGLRYAHGAAYVRTLLQAAGLKLSQFGELSARNEDNVPVPGLVVVAAKV